MGVDAVLAEFGHDLGRLAGGQIDLIERLDRQILRLLEKGALTDLVGPEPENAVVSPAKGEPEVIVAGGTEQAARPTRSVRPEAAAPVGIGRRAFRWRRRKKGSRSA